MHGHCSTLPFTAAVLHSSPASGSGKLPTHPPILPTHPPASPPILPPTHHLPQVLLSIGPSHSYEGLKQRRIYFVFDLLSPWEALAAFVSVHPCGECASGLLAA